MSLPSQPLKGFQPTSPILSIHQFVSPELHIFNFYPVQYWNQYDSSVVEHNIQLIKSVQRNIHDFVTVTGIIQFVSTVLIRFSFLCVFFVRISPF